MFFAFGQLFKFLVRIGAIGAGIVLLVSGWRKLKSSTAATRTAGRVNLVIGLVLLVPFAVEMGLESYFERNAEYNPRIATDQDVLGIYAGSGLRVALLPDGQFVCEDSQSEQILGGAWSRDDWNLKLHTTGQSKQFRIIVFRGDYRIREVKRRRDPDEIGWWEIGIPRISTNFPSGSESERSTVGH